MLRDDGRPGIGDLGPGLAMNTARVRLAARQAVQGRWRCQAAGDGPREGGGTRALPGGDRGAGPPPGLWRQARET